jgi:hypothetical protein
MNQIKIENFKKFYIFIKIIICVNIETVTFAVSVISSGSSAENSSIFSFLNKLLVYTITYYIICNLKITKCQIKCQ